MGRIYKASAVAALIGLGANAFVTPVFAQDWVNPRPVPRSSQGGTEHLEDLLSDTPGFEAQGLSAADGLGGDAMFSQATLADLVAPVALYPDTLLAQILVAATYPLDIVEAERLLDESEGMSDEELSVLIAEQDWDPSVMVLMSGFPDVIRMMADDLDWTDDLGQAMLNQDADVLAAIQDRRRQAYSAGNLVSNEAQRIETRDDQIVIEPADPERVYVPYYDSSQVYSTRSAPAPMLTPQQSPLANPLVAGALAFGGALLVSEFFGEDDGGDDDDDDDWRGYWDRDRSIDWRDRQVYARLDRDENWRSERDRYYDRENRRWRREITRDERRIEDRRQAVRWLERDNERRDDRLDAFRDRERDARREARMLNAEERAREEEREERQRAARQEAREREERADQRDSREREERVERRSEREREAQQQEDRQREERRREARQREAQEEKVQQKAREEQAQRNAREERARENALAEDRAREKAQAEERAQRAASEPKRSEAPKSERKAEQKAERKAEKKAERKAERSGNDGKKAKKCPKGDKSCQ